MDTNKATTDNNEISKVSVELDVDFSHIKVKCDCFCNSKDNVKKTRKKKPIELSKNTD
jgi:hypothetical protein